MIESGSFRRVHHDPVSREVVLHPRLHAFSRHWGEDRRACATAARRVHSRYHRLVADLPLAGRRVELQVAVRRFRCEAPRCARQIFAERFATDILPAVARRTARLEQVVHHVGLALGGRPGAGLAQRLMLPVSRDTLLRVIRRRAVARPSTLTVIGIDDFAWRRNHRYGTGVGP